MLRKQRNTAASWKQMWYWKVVVMKGRYIVMIGMVLLLLTMSVEVNTTVNATLEQVPERRIHAELTPHGQIIIDGNTGLDAWPGEGTAEDPYVIAGLNITFDAICLAISNTNASVVVKDSFFQYTGTEYLSAISFLNANNSRVENCTIIGSWVSIYHHNSYNCNISSNLLLGRISTNNPGVRITHNTINMHHKTSAYGIRILWNTHDAYVFNNTIIGDDAYANGIGIEVLESHNVKVLENSLTGINGVAIQFQESHNATITENTITECQTGIYVSLGDFADIRYNLVCDGNYGMTVQGNNCTVVGNSVFHNDGPGIVADRFNCTFYGNFIGFNLEDWQGFEVQAANFWDDGISVGNYWSDYDGEGVYYVEGGRGGIDHYPQVFTESVITQPADLVVEVGTSETISWSSNGTLPESYVLTIDGELEESDSWDGSVLTFDLGDLVAGVFEFELTTHFGSRMSVSDSVTVTVESASGPSIVLTQVAGIENEAVIVTAVLFDISGILEAILSYSVDNSTWINVTMSGDSIHWNGTIPGQAADTIVGYKVFAWDGLGNLAISDTESFTVAVETLSHTPPMTLYLITGVGVAGVVVIGLVVMKRR